MTDLTTFKNEIFGEVRTVMRDGEPWFVAADVCEFFGVTNRNRVLQNLDDDEKGGTQIDTPGGTQTMTIINEAGLYSLLFYLQPTKARGISDEQIAERCELLRKYKRWITHEVIPSIRKNGAYLTPEAAYKMLSDPQNLIQLLTTLSEKNEEVKLLTSESAEKDRKIAALENECDIRRRQTIKYCAKAMYADAAIGKGENLTIRETAKELGVKESDFTKMLVDRKYLYRRASKQNRLFPYATPKCQGVFVVKEIEFGNGLMFQSQTLVTPIGRAKLTAECVMAGLIKTMPEEHDVLEVW